MSNKMKEKKLDEIVIDNMLISMMEKIFDPVPVPIILVGKDTKVIMINQIFADFLGYSKGQIIGKKVLDVDRNSRFPYVFKSKKAEIAWKHKFENGHTAIVHRIPVLDEKGEVLYGFGMVLFQDVEEFKDIIQKNKLLESELSFYKTQLKEIQGAKYSWENIVGESEKILQAKYMAAKAAQSNSNVLLLGKSGTGKELFAHAIHNASNRSHYPFVKVNCAAIPQDLLESELFGYEEGAFTGAKKGGKVGKFELANGGSIFLDEIGDMPLKMQAKLLRVLQEKEVERIGSNSPKSIDVRVIAATNQNLEEMVAKGQFREDLYYRLNVMSIYIPSLQERKEDIEGLVYRLLEKLSNGMGKYVTKISPKALDYLKGHNWPGNVRELENVLERAINLTDSDTILPAHLPMYITQRAAKKVEGPIPSLKEIVEETEMEVIKRCLEFTKGNKQKAAKLLKISRSSLYDKIERYGLE
ncbi:PAS domain S-box-containing protein [Anaerobranca californiensis DSM 14826]|jgi:PAS domain S-box-containing protein|uniref:PAS domain S-box-containing protein n=1 Tax=Anaerobranca californiensis DSM 14826 TaxID=1120989 RepID=A0A1M6NT64_9FIRM|nr:sigma 54-interacting transcriptional regulator [Anaerobranca californiensis]SHJ98825.1 PAS domain S-box-containing protein [Anaerobranca californiensis DSM 14826]